MRLSASPWESHAPSWTLNSSCPATLMSWEKMALSRTRNRQLRRYLLRIVANTHQRLHGLGLWLRLNDCTDCRITEWNSNSLARGRSSFSENMSCTMKLYASFKSMSMAPQYVANFVALGPRNVSGSLCHFTNMCRIVSRELCIHIHTLGVRGADGSHTHPELAGKKRATL